MALLATLDSHGVLFSFPNGHARIWLIPGMADETPGVMERIEATGFVPNGHRDIWIPPRCVAGEVRGNKSKSLRGWTD